MNWLQTHDLKPAMWISHRAGWRSHFPRKKIVPSPLGPHQRANIPGDQRLIACLAAGWTFTVTPDCQMKRMLGPYSECQQGPFCVSSYNVLTDCVNAKLYTAFASAHSAVLCTASFYNEAWLELSGKLLKVNLLGCKSFGQTWLLVTWSCQWLLNHKSTFQIWGWSTAGSESATVLF